MRKQKTAYELARSQVSTPPAIVKLFWKITHQYRSRFSSVLDLGAGDGRFAVGGRFGAYEGLEIDVKRTPMDGFPSNASIRYGCAFADKSEGYAACVGNPPYVRHHDLDEAWRDTLARRLQKSTDEPLNRKCNLYVYFLLLALLKSRKDGLVSLLVPYEWVSRPSAAPLRDFIKKHKWHVDVYRFTQPIFADVLTTASISVIDKKNRDGQWSFRDLAIDGTVASPRQKTGSNRQVLPYENRGRLWAMRGMSPGTQKVFTLTEGERVHAGLSHADVLPCVTSLRAVPRDLIRLTEESFRRHFVDAGARCWLIRSNEETLSPRLRAYLGAVEEAKRNTWTCCSRDVWYHYELSNAPRLLLGTGFTTYGPKVVVNSVGARAVGSVCGIYANGKASTSRLQTYLTSIDFEKRVVPHAKQLKKLEIRQLNAVLNDFERWEKRNA